MEFRCQACGHLGSAAEVREQDGTVGAVCESCGTWSPLTEPNSESSEASTNESSGVDASQHPRDLQSIRDNIRPEPGTGPRCPKCASLLDENLDNCPRCGLNLERASSYEPGEAPWETPPEGLEGAHRRAKELWEAARNPDDDSPETPTESQEDEGRETVLEPDALEAYVEHVASSNLLEFGVRRLRFHLADHPDDELALRALDDLAGKLQSKVAVAEARVESDAEELAEDVQRVRNVLPWVVFGLIIVAVALISAIIYG